MFHIPAVEMYLYLAIIVPALALVVFFAARNYRARTCQGEGFDIIWQAALTGVGLVIILALLFLMATGRLPFIVR